MFWLFLCSGCYYSRWIWLVSYWIMSCYLLVLINRVLSFCVIDMYVLIIVFLYNCCKWMVCVGKWYSVVMKLVILNWDLNCLCLMVIILLIFCYCLFILILNVFFFIMILFLLGVCVLLIVFVKLFVWLFEMVYVIVILCGWILNWNYWCGLIFLIVMVKCWNNFVWLFLMLIRILVVVCRCWWR